jgi:hypothetical protein
MTGPSGPPAKPAGLQFDKVEGGAAMVCSMCGATITDAYWHLNGRPLCTSCKAKAESQIAALRARGAGTGAMTKAVLLGLGAAIAGAIVYFAVAAITGFEIGLVAIVIGFMVGWSMRKATGGMGGRRYQVLAVAFTYLAVSMAYAALGIREIIKDKRAATPATPATHATAAVADSTAGGDSAIASDSNASPDSAAVAITGGATPANRKRNVGAGAIVAMLGLMLALPLIAVFSSGPSGFLTAIIIGVGLRQAWRMTGGVEIKLTGPYKIGTAPSAAAT